jgi:Zn-dependent M28 family amino/carboxypeptidase
MQKTEQLILNDLSDSEWAIERQAFSFANVVGALDYGDGEPAGYKRLDGANIVATKPGSEPKNAVVVIAHYDTRRDTPGADDNTASVAALLELARTIGGENFRQTVILCATDMEEILCFGAKALVENLRSHYDRVAAINFETMAYTETKPHTQRPETSFGPLYRGQIRRMALHEWAGDFTMIIYRGASSSLAATFCAGLRLTAGVEVPLLFRDPSDLPVLGKILQRTTPFVRNFSRSDHVPFWQAAMPAIQITDTANFRNPHYHQPTDLPGTIDYDRLADIVGATAYTLGATAQLR